MNPLEAKNLSVKLGGRKIVQDISLSLPKGTITGLIGPNGAGKSTLVKALAGLVPCSGLVKLLGKPAADYSRTEKARLLGYLPQERAVHWPLAAEKVIALGRLPFLGPWQSPGAADRLAVEACMKETSTLTLRDRTFHTLAGGEKALVMIARVLAGEPSIILADEPAAGLDLNHELEIFELFQALARKGASILVVLHDLTAAGRFCDRLLLLDQGRTAAFGAPREVLTAENLRKIYSVEADVLFREGEPSIRLLRRLKK